MRWKTSHHIRDPRLIDLLATIALIVAIISAYSYFKRSTEPAPSNAALIEPSQHVRW
ncbi:MAG TPA: hypothetical protein VKR55_11035 [Bradyrhizobium sp.]|uniref:hypothetical protein n=1 Tax=Bradyrhizobium sp. TaxID=376 RepID=UPI002B79C670|nr:hypothetical protein [Bradyrhizobium sp.]HLZ02671.1 hypothetical protein [Bradyrhizobium sp.]